MPAGGGGKPAKNKEPIQAMEKRKMPRMKVDLPVSMAKGENSDPVDVLDFNIHGMAFQSEKFYLRGTRLDFWMPQSRGGKKLPGEVIQCRVNEETLDGSYRVGVKFLFGSKRSFTGQNENAGFQTLRIDMPPEESKEVPVGPATKNHNEPLAQRDASAREKPTALSLKQEMLQETERIFGLVFVRRSRFYFLSPD